MFNISYPSHLLCAKMIKRRRRERLEITHEFDVLFDLRGSRCGDLLASTDTNAKTENKTGINPGKQNIHQ